MGNALPFRYSRESILFRGNVIVALNEGRSALLLEKQPDGRLDDIHILGTIHSLRQQDVLCHPSMVELSTMLSTTASDGSWIATELVSNSRRFGAVAGAPTSKELKRCKLWALQASWRKHMHYQETLENPENSSAAAPCTSCDASCDANRDSVYRSVTAAD
jgi:hypothetical protein